jgi:hypothetical protein
MDQHNVPKAISMSTLTALRLIDSLNQLREDIAVQGAMINSIDVAMTAMYAELRQYIQLKKLTNA